MKERVGVFICHCGTNIAKMVRIKDVVDYAAKLPGVVHSTEHKYMCSDPGQLTIKEAIKEHNITRVVIASCSPLMHEPTFRRTVAEAGLNPFYMQMANIREQDSWVSKSEDEATAKANRMVAAAVRRVHLAEPLEIKKLKVHPEVLVIGAGVAGMEAALRCADAGVKVHVVEREATIGGKAVLYDKTFPTLDCAACILTPKMVSVAQHKNITTYTLSEISDVQGSVGDFWVTIKQKPRYVDLVACNACRSCIEACTKVTKRLAIPNPYDFGLSTKAAVDFAFAQAVPNKPYIDAENCLYLSNRAANKCRACEKLCPTKAINFDEPEKEIKIHVGGIILATGFELVDVKNSATLWRYGYGRYPGVYTSLEMERLTSSSGPTGGKIVLRDGKTAPKSIAILHCIGSRDKTNNSYCSRLCCMAALKMAHLLKERVPDAKVYNLYIDVRAAGKGYEEFYTRILGEGVEFIKGKAVEVHSMVENDADEGKLVVRVEDINLGMIRSLNVDMVVLQNGLVPAKGSVQLAQTLHVSCAQGGFFLERHPKLAPVAVATDGIYVAGCCQGPKDIPDSVGQALGAASHALQLILAGEVALEPTVAEVMEKECSGCKTCLRICPYNAISFDEAKKVAVINPALCKGCGTCVAACPSAAIKQWGFTDEQILAEIDGILASAAEQ